MNSRRSGERQFLRSGLLIPTLSAVIITLATLLFCEKAGATQPIKHAEYLPFDGAKLYLLIRGADRTAPVLLWLHGGPGAAERPLFRYFNGRLERDFVVVYWDQRGAGRSFDAKTDPSRLTIAQHLADLDGVVKRDGGGEPPRGLDGGKCCNPSGQRMVIHIQDGKGRVAACRVACPPDGSDRAFRPANGDFYSR